MKKVFFSTAIVSIALFTFACSKDRPSAGATYWGHGFGMGYGMGCYDDQTSMMGDLGITGKQSDKIADIDAKYRQLYFENRGNFDKIDALRRDHRKEIDGVLNQTQQNRFNNVYNNRWGGWGRGYGRGHMGDFYGHGYGMGYGSGCYATGDYMRQDLNLTPAQEKKIADIDLKYRDLYYKNRGNFSKIDTLRMEHRRAIEKVLTPDQRNKYQQIYNNRWRGWGGGRGMGPGMMGY